MGWTKRKPLQKQCEWSSGGGGKNLQPPHGAAVVEDVFLNPGDYYFGGGNVRVRTLLGSCVSLTVWHPRLKIGGMCHFLLPRRTGLSEAKDGRFGEEAMDILLRNIQAANTRPEEYQVKLFGGGSMFYPPRFESGAGCDIPRLNVEMGRELVQRYGLHLEAEDLGGFGHRQVLFDIGSGDVWVRRNTAAFSQENVKPGADRL